jgi:hypothetical protein
LLWGHLVFSQTWFFGRTLQICYFCEVSFQTYLEYQPTKKKKKKPYDHRVKLHLASS